MRRLLVAAGLLLASPAWSAHAPAHLEPAAPAAALSEGEVRKVDRAAGKVTLRHGPLANLDMPGMTMVFRVPDAKLLESMKEGERIRFRAEKIAGAFVVTEVER